MHGAWRTGAGLHAARCMGAWRARSDVHGAHNMRAWRQVQLYNMLNEHYCRSAWHMPHGEWHTGADLHGTCTTRSMVHAGQVQSAWGALHGRACLVHCMTLSWHSCALLCIRYGSPYSATDVWMYPCPIHPTYPTSPDPGLHLILNHLDLTALDHLDCSCPGH